VFYDIRWIVWKVKMDVAAPIAAGTHVAAYIQISSLPVSLSQVDTSYNSYVWSGRAYTRIVQHTIDAPSWLALLGDFPSSQCALSTVTSSYLYVSGRKKLEVRVSFTLDHSVP